MRRWTCLEQIWEEGLSRESESGSGEGQVIAFAVFPRSWQDTIYLRAGPRRGGMQVGRRQTGRMQVVRNGAGGAGGEERREEG